MEVVSKLDECYCQPPEAKKSFIETHTVNLSTAPESRLIQSSTTVMLSSL